MKYYTTRKLQSSLVFQTVCLIQPVSPLPKSGVHNACVLGYNISVEIIKTGQNRAYPEPYKN